MLQHRTLRTVLPYPLHRKLLESIQETYIAFAVSARPAPVNDRLARLLIAGPSGLLMCRMHGTPMKKNCCI